MSSFFFSSKKSKDKELTQAKSDSKPLTITNGSTVSVITHKSEFKSYSKSSTSRTEITVTTKQLDQRPTIKPTFTTSKKEISGSVAVKKNVKKDAIPFSNELVYKSNNMQIHKPLLPSVLSHGDITSKTSYQSPYRSSSGLPSFGSKNYSFAPVGGTPISINKTSTTITKPKTSEASPSPVSYNWNNPPKTSSSFVPKKPSEPLIVKSTRKQSPGVVYIFHNDKFDTSNEFRNGSAADVLLLKKTFKNFKTPITLYENLTVKEVTNAVQKIERKDFGSCSCIVIVILTHGTRHGTVFAKDGGYSINDDVLFPILRNKSLISKPKLFFVQACKGSMETEHFHKDAMPASGCPQEILKCYSTFEGYVAYRTEKGTFFIQALCELLQEHGKTTNIKDIMDKVIKRVQETTKYKQIPSYETTLTKPYIFGDYV